MSRRNNSKARSLCESPLSRGSHSSGVKICGKHRKTRDAVPTAFRARCRRSPPFLSWWPPTARQGAHLTARQRVQPLKERTIDRARLPGRAHASPSNAKMAPNLRYAPRCQRLGGSQLPVKEFPVACILILFGFDTEKKVSHAFRFSQRLHEDILSKACRRTARLVDHRRGGQASWPRRRASGQPASRQSAKPFTPRTWTPVIL